VNNFGRTISAAALRRFRARRARTAKSPRPLDSGAEAADIPYARAAEEAKMTEGAVRVAVHRLRRRYRELLREEITQTLANPAHADEEMQALFSALAEG
jgi:RNA polymerase sigma-70 factor (ECF subfamily)